MTATLANAQAAKSQKPRGGRRLVLRGIDWDTYSRLLRTFDERHIRLTYDRGTLEIMTLSHGHEDDSSFLERIVVILTMVASLPIKHGGSTTIRRKRKQRGLEPDRCYWITNEAMVRGKRVIDLRRDPPPDLAIEVEVTRSALKRLAIYAALGVPEVWRWDGTTLTLYLLKTDGQYIESTVSRLFPWLKAVDVPPFLAMRSHMDENAVAVKFETWARAQIASQLPVKP
jgi:Uma2 family endonuclease